MVDFRAEDEAELRALYARLGMSQKTIDAAIEARKGEPPKPDHPMLHKRRLNAMNALPIRLRGKDSRR